MKPRVVYNTKVMLPSAKKDSVPTTQKSCAVYEFLCRREARYVGRTTQRLADRITQHVQRLKEVNPNVRIIVSSILLQKYDTPKNLYIVESNAALERNCFSNGWDFLNNSNIAFKHIDKWGMHHTPEGYHLFASNLHAHSFSG